MGTHSDQLKATNPKAPSWFILGLGRLGYALTQAMSQQGLKVLGAWNRSPLPPSSLPCQVFTGKLPTTLIQHADILLLSVSDTGLSPVITQLQPFLQTHQQVAHFAGRFDSSILAPLQEKGAEVGSLHPLQPISFDQNTNDGLFAGVSVGVEGQSKTIRNTLTDLIQMLGGNAFSLQGVDRAGYHAAAVFASNYVVTLAAVAQELMQTSGISQQTLPLLVPLMEQAIANIKNRGLPDALTGPIARADQGAIDAHLQCLNQTHPSLAPLYTSLAQHTLPIAAAQRSKHKLDITPLKALEEALKSM